MRIKKTSQYIEGGASLSNTYGESNENGYTQEYINGDILFETDNQNPLGISDNITLSDSIDNYKEIEIFYNRYGLLKSIKVPTNVRITNTNPNDIFAVCDILLFINNLLRIYTTTYKITGTSMTRSAYTYWNTNSASPTINAENQITITKVIGYK